MEYNHYIRNVNKLICKITNVFLMLSWKQQIKIINIWIKNIFIYYSSFEIRKNDVSNTASSKPVERRSTKASAS